MSEKNFNSRIVHKHDLETNWLKAVNFVPKQGELIVYDVDNIHNYERLKMGDGVTTVSNLPFIAEAISTSEIDEICGASIVIVEEEEQ